jgi:hypothetical protein
MLSETYRQKAAECLMRARSMTDAHNKARMIDIALDWESLAREVEKNHARETAARRAAPSVSSPGQANGSVGVRAQSTA